MIDSLRLVLLAFVILHAVETFVRDARARGVRGRADGVEPARARASFAVTIWIVIQLSPALYYSAELLKVLLSAS